MAGWENQPWIQGQDPMSTHLWDHCSNSAYHGEDWNIVQNAVSWSETYTLRGKFCNFRKNRIICLIFVFLYFCYINMLITIIFVLFRWSYVLPICPSTSTTVFLGEMMKRFPPTDSKDPKKAVILGAGESIYVHALFVHPYFRGNLIKKISD